MRRQKSLSVTVKAPSRGLISRWPGSTEDMLASGSVKNTMVAGLIRRSMNEASNVRFEDGVVCSAPGCERVSLDFSLLDGLVAHWRLDEGYGDRVDASGNGLTLQEMNGPVNSVPGKLGAAAQFNPADTASPFLYSSAPSLTGLGSTSFTVTGWFQVGSPRDLGATFFKSPASALQINGDGTLTMFVFNSPSLTLTTLTTTDTASTGWNFVVASYDAVNGIASVALNGGTPAQGSVVHPADSSAASLTPNFQISSGLYGAIQYPFGSITEVSQFDRWLDDSPVLYSLVGNPFDVDPAIALSVDSVSVWSRVLTSAESAFLYASGSGEDYPFTGGAPSLIHQGKLIAEDGTPLIIGTGGNLWSGSRSRGSDGTFQLALEPIYAGNATSSGFNWVAADFYNKVILAQHDNPVQYWTTTQGQALAMPGLTVGDEYWDGCTVFFNHAVLWKDDRMLWSDASNFSLFIPVSTTAVSAVLTTLSSFVQPAPGGTVSIPITTPSVQVLSIALSGIVAFTAAVGDTQQQVLTVSNTGTGPLSVTGLTLPDGFSGNFTGTIPVNGSVGVIITFAPTQAASYGGAVTVASNATDGTTSIPISGTGTGDTYELAVSGVLDFGEVWVGYSAQSGVVLTNTGTATVTVSGVTLPTGFAVAPGGWASGTIAAGITQVVPVVFTPTAVESYAGVVTVSSDATGGAIATGITGQGTKTGFRGLFVTDRGTCQFGKVATGSSATGHIYITNTGTGTVNVLQITLPTSGGTAVFSGGFAGAVAPRATQSFPLVFTPTGTGGFGGELLVSVSQSDVVGALAVSISGTGIVSGKVLEISGNMSFGSVPVGGSASALLSVVNNGTLPVTVSAVSSTSAAFTAGTIGVIPPGGEAKNVLVTFSPTAVTPYTATLSITSDAIGSPTTATLTGNGIAVQNTVPTLEAGQFVSLADTRDTATFYNYYTVISMTTDESGNTTINLKRLDTTGATASGLTVPTASTILTVDANEAGTQQVVGDYMNGKIFAVVPLTEYAFILKERSIISVQYVGQASGTFFVRGAVRNEGPIARNAYCVLNDSRIVFLGHKELYAYSGGDSGEPVCQQTTRQLYQELNRSRLDEISLFHNEERNEVWVVYPTSGSGFRVLIWNYLEDTATIDDYDGGFQMTALSLVDWSSSTTWAQIPQSQTWADILGSWGEQAGSAQDHVTVFGSIDGNIRVHGRLYTRDGEAYTAASETMDFDFDDPDIWKYVDAVFLGLDVRVPSGSESKLYVQVGQQAMLGQAPVGATVAQTEDLIDWTEPVSVDVSGNSTVPVKVNPGGAGRYLRLRFISTDPDVKWRVSHFAIHCRPGGLY